MAVFLLGCLLLAAPSSSRAYELTGGHWPTNQPIVMDLQLGNPGGMLFYDGSNSWDDAAEEALKVWNLYLGSQVYFESNRNVITPAERDGINSVYFSITVDGEYIGDDTLAVTVSLYKQGKVKAESDVIFNRYKQFNSYRGPTKRGNYDLRRVALHEFGHVLGLDHVDQNSQSIMTPYITDIDALQDDDIAGVQAIYGAPTPPAPLINSGLDAKLLVGRPFGYQITATRTPATSYRATGLPAGLTLDTATGVISGTPTVAGTFPVLIEASNAVGTGTATLALTVLAQPTITSGTIAAGVLGVPFSFQITAAGGANDFSSPNVPPGLTLDPRTGLLSGTPTLAGFFYVELKASNGIAATTSNLSLTIVHDTSLTVLHNFGGTISQGEPAMNSLFLHGDGNFYGVANYGKDVVKLTQDGTKTPVYSLPWGGEISSIQSLVSGKDGQLYGVARLDSTYWGASAIFRLTTDGKLTELYRTADGSSPSGAGLFQATDGNLYGVLSPPYNYNYSTPNSIPTDSIFKLTPSGEFTVLHAVDVSPSYYSRELITGLIQAKDGNFYGVTSYAINGDYGTIFRCTPNGGFTTLHAFPSSEGLLPWGSLLQASDGNFYGRTNVGTNRSAGTLYRMTPDGAFTTIYSFAEGSYYGAVSNLVQGTDGSFYGMASRLNGGPVDSSTGILFKWNLDGTFALLHRFVSSEGMASGMLIPDGFGNLYGLTSAYGLYYANMFFRVAESAVIQEVVPVVSLKAVTPTLSATKGAVGYFLLTISPPPQAETTVRYTVKGSARGGSDYAQLSGSAKIKIGKKQKKIVVRSLGDLGGADKKVVSLKLESGPGYIVAKPDKAKVKLLAP